MSKAKDLIKYKTTIFLIYNACMGHDVAKQALIISLSITQSVKIVDIIEVIAKLHRSIELRLAQVHQQILIVQLQHYSHALVCNTYNPFIYWKTLFRQLFSVKVLANPLNISVEIEGHHASCHGQRDSEFRK